MEQQLHPYTQNHPMQQSPTSLDYLGTIKGATKGTTNNTRKDTTTSHLSPTYLEKPQYRFVASVVGAIAWFCCVTALTGLIWAGTTVSALADTEFNASARARIYTTEAQPELLGVATFVPTEDGMEVNAELSDIAPGYHGFHIHEFGSCADGGAAAGGHFNPLETQHGYLPQEGLDDAHAGDLGNILIGSKGTGTLQEMIPPLPLMTGRLAIAQHAVIVHAERDDFGQPTGHAGGRIGCGIIELASESE